MFAALTPRRIYPLAAIAVVVILVLYDRIAPHDFWWHVATGRTIATTGAIPTLDTSSFTKPNVAVFDQPWLAQLLMYGLFAAGGPALVIVAQALVVGSTCALVLWLLTRVTGRPLTATLVFLFAVVPLAAPNWSVRPQSYALPLFAAVFAFATAYARGWRCPLWPIAPLIVLWVNLHGSFLLGVGILGLMSGVEGARCFRRAPGALSAAAWRKLVYATLVAAAATLANPRGLAIYSFAFGVSRQLTGAEMFAEWARPSPFTRGGWALFVVAFGLVVVLALAFVRAKWKPRATDLVLAVVFLFFALTAVRNIIWFGFVTAPLFAEALAALLPRLEEDATKPSGVSGVVAVVLGLALIVALPWTRARANFRAAPFVPYTDETPVAAVAHLRALAPPRRPERLFHTEGTGSYLIWAAPEQPIFIDPRFALYPIDLWRDMVRITSGSDADALLAKYRIDGLLLVRPKEEALVAHVDGSAGWEKVYEDDSSALFVARASTRGR